MKLIFFYNNYWNHSSIIRAFAKFIRKSKKGKDKSAVYQKSSSPDWPPTLSVARDRLIKLIFWHDLPAFVFDRSRVTRVGSSWFSITHLETTDIHQPCIPLPCNYTVATHVNPLMVGLFVSLYAYTAHI